MHNLKALGLALLALFAMSAVAASTASAQTLGKVNSDGPVTLKVNETGVGLNRLTAFGTYVECPGSGYTGHKTNTVNTGIASGETSATIRPTYKNCKLGDGSTATVDMNGCHYAFYDATTTPESAPHTYGVKADIVGTNCTHIVVTTNLCAMTIKKQTGITGAHLTTTTGLVPEDVDLTGEFTGIHAVCGFLTTSSADLDVDVRIKGFNPATGLETGVTITH